LLFSLMDVTEREHVNNALRESEERFRIIFERSVDNIQSRSNG